MQTFLSLSRGYHIPHHFCITVTTLYHKIQFTCTPYFIGFLCLSLFMIKLPRFPYLQLVSLLFLMAQLTQLTQHSFYVVKQAMYIRYIVYQHTLKSQLILYYELDRMHVSANCVISEVRAGADIQANYLVCVYITISPSYIYLTHIT